MKKENTVVSYLIIAACAALAGVSYHIFILPNQFAPSGLNGLATMVQYVFGFKISYMNLIINIPLLIVAYLVLDKRYALRTLTYVVVFSAVMLLLETVDLSGVLYHTQNGTSTVLAPVAAGVISGFCNGAALKRMGSSGGTDIVAGIIHKKKPYLNLVWMIFGLNTVVAGLSYFVYGFKIEPVLLCIIYSFLIGRVSSAILQGGKEAVKFEVITDHAEDLSARLISELRHSVTVIPATGMYSHTGKEIVFCVVNKHQVVAFQEILQEYPDTFAYISTVRETVGNFKKIM